MKYAIKPKARYTFFATGTEWSVTFGSSRDKNSALSIINTAVHDFSWDWSRFAEKSQIMKLAEDGGTVLIHDTRLLDFYKDLSDVTNGLISPAIASQMNQAGYDATYRFTPKELTTIAPWLEIVSWDTKSISCTEPLELDIGAAGKGALVDIIAEKLSGLDWHAINAGGDILVNNTSTIGLEMPTDHAKIIGTIQLSTGAICASAPQRRDWGEYHHILNPESKSSPREILGAWVIADSAMIADGIATALFLVQPDTLSRFDFEYAILKPDGAFTMSNGFVSKFKKR